MVFKGYLVSSFLTKKEEVDWHWIWNWFLRIWIVFLGWFNLGHWISIDNFYQSTSITKIMYNEFHTRALLPYFNISVFTAIQLYERRIIKNITACFYRIYTNLNMKLNSKDFKTSWGNLATTVLIMRKSTRGGIRFDR